MRTHVHISVTKWCIVGFGTSAFQDLWDGSIENAYEKKMSLEILHEILNYLVLQ